MDHVFNLNRPPKERQNGHKSFQVLRTIGSFLFKCKSFDVIEGKRGVHIEKKKLK